MTINFKLATSGLLLAALLTAASAQAATVITPAFGQTRPASTAPASQTLPQGEGRSQYPPPPWPAEALAKDGQGEGQGGDGGKPFVPASSSAHRPEAPTGPALVYGDRVLSEDTAWRGEILVEGVLVVAPQATLSVEPGTTVRFRRKGAQAPLLVVQGRLVAAGTRETPVLFTSSFVEPTPGDWQGILFLGSEKKNQLENCRIEGAETGLEALFSNVTLKAVFVDQAGTGMRFQDTLVVVDGGGASNCDTGLQLTESEATLRNLSLVANRQGLTAQRSSVYLSDANLSGNRAAAFSADSSRVKVQGGALLGNGSGATLLDCEGSVTGTKLANNREFGLSLTSSRVKVSGNVISGNGSNGIVVFGGAAVAWDNAIYQNAGYDLYHAGVEEFRAPANWWGEGVPKIFDNGGRGRVLYQPVLAARPAPQAR